MIPNTPECEKKGKKLNIMTDDTKKVIVRLVTGTRGNATEITKFERDANPGQIIEIKNLYMAFSVLSTPINMAMPHWIEVYGFDENDGASTTPWESQNLTVDELTKIQVVSGGIPSDPTPPLVPSPAPLPNKPKAKSKNQKQDLEYLRVWLRQLAQDAKLDAETSELMQCERGFANVAVYIEELEGLYPGDEELATAREKVRIGNEHLDKIALAREQAREKTKTAKTASVSPAQANAQAPIAATTASTPPPAPTPAPAVVPATDIVFKPINQTIKPSEEKSDEGKVSVAEALATLAEAQRVLNEAKATRTAVEEMVTKAAAEKAAATPTSTPKDKLTDDEPKGTKPSRKSPVSRSDTNKSGWAKWLIPILILAAFILGAMKFIDWKKNQPAKAPSTPANSLVTGVIPVVTTSTNTQSEIGDAKVIATANPGSGSAFSASIKGDGGKIVQVAGNYYGNDIGESFGKKQGWPKKSLVDKNVYIDFPSDGSKCIYALVPAGEYHRFQFASNLKVYFEFFDVPVSQISMEVDGVEVDIRERDKNRKSRTIGYFNGGSEVLRIKINLE